MIELLANIVSNVNLKMLIILVKKNNFRCSAGSRIRGGYSFSKRSVKDLTKLASSKAVYRETQMA